MCTPKNNYFYPPVNQFVDKEGSWSEWSDFSLSMLHFIYTVNVNWIRWPCYIYHTTFNNGSLGSRIDEERSELWYVMWIAEFSESSNFRTHIAPSGIPEGMPVWVSLNNSVQKQILFVLASELEGLLKTIQLLLNILATL